MALVSVPDKSPLIIAVCSVLIFFTVLAIALRFLSRSLAKAGFWWDDWLSLLTLFLSLALNALVLYGTHRGFGKHAVDIPQNQTSFFFKMFLVGEILYFVSISLCKASILCFYSRIFGPVKTFRWALKLTAVLVVCWGISGTFAVIFQCSPVKKTWELETPGTCTVIEAQFISTASLNVLIDLVLLLLPLPVLWRLHITKRQKIGLMGVFVLGYLIPVVSIIRLVSLVTLGAKNYEDVTWSYVDPFLWTTTELGIAVVCISLPSISPLFRQTADRFFASRSVNAIPQEAPTNSWLKRSKSSNRPFHSSANSDFIQLKDQPIVSVTAGLSSSDEEVGNNYTAVSIRDVERRPTSNGKRRSSDMARSFPLNSIHVRNDLDLRYEPRT